MKTSKLPGMFLLLALAPLSWGSVPKDYKGKPFVDATHTAGAQTIPGRLQTAFYDLGGEGIAYHDTDRINHGSGELNYHPGHCEAGVPVSICHFRENEGVDLSYAKKLADLKYPSRIAPKWQQLYIGWSENGEWTNYTVYVKKAGTYRIIAMYSNVGQTIYFSLNNKRAASCTLPSYPLRHEPDWMIWHTWNKADCGEISFPKTGLQLLTLHYKQGNNLAYFDFVPVDEHGSK
ncbi:MAG TPA: hypothetical protein VHX63_01750 [Acidobacteriaceae bacterium]|jgi:hypothetical protein|nr:hypothetical protein [Acidobacteriaceae bacterium]